MVVGAPYRNVHGRRPGRGLRPWLLIPKIVSMAVFIGGLASLLVLILLRPHPVMAAEWAHEAEWIRRAYTLVIVPGFLGAFLFGGLLALAHPRVFARMRWLQAKLGLVITFVPALHLLMRSRSLALHEAIAAGDFGRAALLRGQLLRGTLVALLFALAMIVLGRVKPRLAQNFARSFGRGTTPAVPPPES